MVKDIMKTPIKSTWISKDFPNTEDTRIYEMDLELYNKILNKVYFEREYNRFINLAKATTGVEFTKEQIIAIRILFKYWLEKERQGNLNEY